ncbi:hypothetical protein [Phytoactinopolyspora halotolerans]|uniref:FCD domain-containing protein n=1 Tax=Phytoactinopolyspora halotolerans TaxID=1981512 RepID=A0A6L9SAQ4_9ACTN|nr:hypothetical protein [Phytoactinopolyspora halotolerans]NEE02445.1 hypothetical protein [Phytoactinopolyspora halotolerans]
MAAGAAQPREAVVAVGTSEQPHTIQLWHSILPRVRAQFMRLGGYHSSPSDIVDEHTQLLDALKTWALPEIHKLLDEHVSGAARRLLARKDAAGA